jgi:hypothetical protein
MPEVGPHQGKWVIPNPDLPGRFIHFEKRDLYADADIRLDLTSQVLRDDTVVVQQGMQLLDVFSKILMAPPEILRKLMPFMDRTVAAMGPDWEAKIRDMQKPEADVDDPRNEHLMFAAGEYIKPDQNEDLAAHLASHVALLKTAPRDPALSKLFMQPIGVDENGATITGLVLLAQHIEATEEIASAKGMAQETGAQPKGKQGSGPGSGRVPQGAPSSGELAAQASNVENMPKPGIRGMMTS